MLPPLETADEDGLLAIGGDLSGETLTRAYHSGIFPWPIEDFPTLWFAPPQRCVLLLAEFHVSKRLRRDLKKTHFEYSIDGDFASVIKSCAAPRAYEKKTWILPEMQSAYGELHRAGHAHSVEVHAQGALVGGLYGVSWGNYFCGESMFHRVDNASKAALIFLVEHLQSRGATWLDVQMPTPLFLSFGARLILRGEFMALLGDAMKSEIALFD